jgi:hypothetical protein
MTIMFPNLELTPTAPGRGAWKLTGGLLPVSPTSASKTGYYRRPAATEVMVGSKGAKLATATFSERMVWYGVRGFQSLLNVNDDGYFGDDTATALLKFQKSHGLDEDGILGPASALEMLRPMVAITASAHRIPAKVLGGIAKWESGLDPAAVGVNGLDLGLVQINSGSHDVTMAQASDPQWALNFAADDLASLIAKWTGKTKVDVVKIAVANHNSPALAQQWATTGKVPFSQSRKDAGFPQIDEYVASVLAAGEAF